MTNNPFNENPAFNESDSPLAPEPIIVSETVEDSELVEETTQESDNDGTASTVVVYQTDHTGQEIAQTLDFSTPPLTRDQAVEITEAIRNTGTSLFILMKRAHEGQAYKALGYKTFAEYAKEEFSYSKSYAYRLLSQANIIEAIEAKIPEGTEFHISEPLSRRLKPILPELLTEIEERITTDTEKEEAGQILEEILIDHTRTEANTFLPEEEEDAYIPRGDGDGVWTPNEPEEDEDEGEKSASEINTEQLRQNFETIYDLHSGLKRIVSIEGEDGNEGSWIIAMLPPNRRVEWAELTERAVKWLTPWLELLKEQIEKDAAESEDEDDENEDEEVYEDDDYTDEEL